MGVKVFQTSLSAAVIILLVVIIHALAINRLPKKTFVILWNIVLCRLLIPFNIPLSLSVFGTFNSSEKALDQTKNIIKIVPGTTIHRITNSKSVLTGITDGGLEASSTPTAVLSFVQDKSIVVLIWSTVGIMIAIFFLVTHLQCLRKYKMALPITDHFPVNGFTMYPIKRTIQIKLLDTIAVPLTYGIWKPVILLPKMIGRAEGWRLKYVIVHELTHIKHFDVLKKWLLAAALCIHWFNPLVWLMYILANRDIELACDEAVVRAFGQTSRSSYALALIDMEGAKAGLLPLCSGFNKRAIEERVISIMRTKEATTFTRLLAFVLVLAVMFTFAVSLVEAKMESKAMGLFRMALGDCVYEYADSINEIAEESAAVVTEDCTIRLQSTIFTDHNVYAIMAVEGELPEDFSISGRIVDPEDTPRIPRWKYMLFGSMEEIGYQDGVRYFLCSATITDWLYIKPQDIDEEFIEAHTNPDSDYLKYESLKNCEGKTLELTLNLNGSKYILTTVVTNVFTKNIVFYPEPDLYDGYCIEEIMLTPFELKIRGCSREIGEHSKSTGEYGNEWIEPHIRATIVLVDGQEINLDYDDRRLFFYQRHPISVIRNYDTSTGKFYRNWRFSRWELDLSQVAAITVNGITYRVDRQED
jgi:beta-lactamase regulating signal transducer with metallopeptidase domain